MIWGHRRVRGGNLSTAANAWSTDVVWGDATGADGQPIVWGTRADGEAWSGTEEDEPIALEPPDVAVANLLEPATADRWTRMATGVSRAGMPAAIAPDGRRRTRKELDLSGSDA